MCTVLKMSNGIIQQFKKKKKLNNLRVLIATGSFEIAYIPFPPPKRSM